MTKKMIERFVIVNKTNEIVNSAEDLEELTTEESISTILKGESKPRDNLLRVYDREFRRSIAKADTLDKYFNFHIAQAIVDACDSYVPPEPPEPEVENEVNDGSD